MRTTAEIAVRLNKKRVESYSIIGNRINKKILAEMKRQGKTAYAIAKEQGLNKARVYARIKGRDWKQVILFYRICRSLNIDIDELFKGDFIKNKIS